MNNHKQMAKSKSFRGKKYDYAYALLLISPMLIGYIIFLILPLIATFGMSLTNYSMIRGTEFVGLQNYIDLFTSDEHFKCSMINTIYYSVLYVPLTIILSLGLALLLNKSIPGVGLFRTIMFTPYITIIAVWGIVWRFIFQTDNGAINLLLRTVFNVQGPMWLYNEKLAIPIIAISSVIKGIGMNMIIFLAALKSVPATYYEAGELEGATGLHKLWHITLPLISPTLFLNLVMSIILSLRVFGMVNTMTKGGPGVSSYVLVYYIFIEAFTKMKFGNASAASVIMFTVIMIITVIQWKLRKRWVYYET